MPTVLTFPITIPNPEYPFKVEHEDNSIATKFEDGTVQSRLKFTRSRQTWTLKWNGLPQNHYNTLKNFIVNVAKHQANRFNWTDPTDNTVYSVRCIKFDEEMVFINNWNIEIQLQES